MSSREDLIATLASLDSASFEDVISSAYQHASVRQRRPVDSPRSAGDGAASRRVAGEAAYVQ